MALIHGDRDGQSPIAVSEEIAARHPDLVTLERVPGAGHCQTWNVDPVRYGAALDALLGRALGNSGGMTSREGSAIRR